MYFFKRDGIYYVELFDPNTGKNIRRSTKQRNKTLALEYVRNLEIKLKQKMTRKIISLAEYEQEYLKIKSTHSKKYLESIKLSFKGLKNYLPEITPLDRINNVQLEKFIMHVFSKSESLAGLYYRTLKAAFYKAEKWEYIKSNPFRNVKLPRAKKNLPVFFSEDILNKIIDQEKQPQLKLLYLFGFHTGMRLSEILNARWKDISFEERIINVKNTEEFTLKGKKQRVIPLNCLILNKLIERRSTMKIIDLTQEEYIFYKLPGVKLLPDYVSKRFKKCVKALKDIDQNIHMHSLRHSFASNLVQRGAGLFVIKELLGHEDLKTTQLYAHLQRSDLHSAVSLLENPNNSTNNHYSTNH